MGLMGKVPDQLPQEPTDFRNRQREKQGRFFEIEIPFFGACTFNTVRNARATIASVW